VQKAASGAECLEANPSQQLSDIMLCSCGCIGCAIACDGEGLAWGQSQTLWLGLPASLPGAGSLGLMVRARGTGLASVTLTLQDATSAMLDTVTLTQDFADSISTTTYSWTTTSGRPTSIELETDPTSSVEVDCVVPYLAP
jgi:hypothetical protein